jgi:8-oxo-dGTP pyrophosphatase MutT (NUDIX family)
MADDEIKHRVAGRVILLDPRGRVLLFRGFDPARPGDSWWSTPGGGLSAGEAPRDAAARELREETGLDVAPETLGEPVFEDVAEFSFNGRRIRQRNLFFVLRTEPFEVSTAGFDETEVLTHVAYRWWDAAELRQTSETFVPTELPDLVAPVRTDPRGSGSPG